MKNIYFYYFAIITPLVLMIFFLRMFNINSLVFVSFLFTYTLIYRTYIDGLRLVSKGVIEKNEIWKMFYRGLRVEHFKELYLK
ncbi:hypothetical protein SAMN04487764_0926 [Gillisia sp. Hel1_33_143]|uniref:hypothetical protein n=1 Tax=Gillisia sp. Hel1_33_143 TaxID=1336796 RepID=UPI00087A3AB6|nr:hypothetical protein [Gillisia sp. Hel1_33_143]SDR88194.1 hypothetical protein SAMN04487764_0926 [Gillisia sp. Hel1_33_143]